MHLSNCSSKLDSFDVVTERLETCPLCQSDDTAFLFWNFDRLYHLPGKFGVVQCKSCGLIRLSPRPTKEILGFYYPEDNYYSYQVPVNTITGVNSRPLIGKIRDGIRNSVLQHLGYSVPKLAYWQKFLQPLFVIFFKKQATYGWNDRFPRYCRGGRALDIGCGSGAFLSYLKTNGWEVHGVELNEKAASVAREQFGIDVFIGQLENAPFEPNSFDFINISHVLEHLPEPTSFLLKTRELLKDTGTIYIEVPNYDSLSRRLTGKYWFPWETPRHLYMYSPSTIKKQVEIAGFKLIKLKTKIEDFYEIAARYEVEENRGEKLPEGTQLPPKKRAKAKMFSVLSRLGQLVGLQNGDFICCWIRKDI